MEIFNKIFEELSFTRVKIVDGYAIYYAKIQSFTGDGHKYVILVVQNRRDYSPEAKISSLPWSSLQTRTLDEYYNLPEQTINHKLLDHRYSDNKIKLTLKEVSEVNSTYYCTIPVEVVLIHDIKKKSKFQYNETLELRQALSTFQCVVKRL
jgi:hypothetical protein